MRRRVVKWAIRIAGGLVAAFVLFIVVYLAAMSGAWYTPKPVLEASAYNPPEGKILIIGGNRATGLDIVKGLVDHGEDVTVMVRKTSNVDALNALGIKQVIGDAMIESQVQAAVNSDNYTTVISTLGTSSSDLPASRNFFTSLIQGQVKMDPNKRPDWVGNRHIIDAAEAAGVERFLFVTVIGVGTSFEGLPAMARRGRMEAIPLKAKAEEHLRKTSMDYTIIRPGGLSNGPVLGAARLTEDYKAFSFISRAETARLTVEAFGNNETIGKTYTAWDPERDQVWHIVTGK
jgi:uncharacterized protein YbjT (DUF2867 family)